MLGATVSSILAVLGPVVFLLISPPLRAVPSERRSHAATEVGPMETAGADSLQHLLQESYSGLHTALRAVLQDSASFREMWERATLGHRPVPPVDFNREMVIVVAMGAQSSTGHAIHIQSVRAHGAALDVHVVLAPAAQGCGPGMMETYPMDMVRVPREDRRLVTFVERIEEVRCRS
jgi:hypothetical protein